MERHSRGGFRLSAHSARSRHDGCNQGALSWAIDRPEILAISGTIEHRDPDTHPGGGSGGAASPLLRGERWHSVLPLMEIFFFNHCLSEAYLIASSRRWTRIFFRMLCT